MISVNENTREEKALNLRFVIDDCNNVRFECNVDDNKKEVVKENDKYFHNINLFVDKYLPSLDLSETKLLFVIIKETVGTKVAAKRISYADFRKNTGLSKMSISSAIKSLESKNLIKVIRDGQRSYYEATLIKREDM